MKSMFPQRAPRVSETLELEQLNRIPAPEGLKERHESLIPGMVNTWYEYVPACYDGTKPFPLVVQLHGGGNDGRRWADWTVWHLLAEREGLLIVYPNSPACGSWACDDRDIQYVMDLIEKMKERYAVDASRIYMQGMSNGDMMTLAFTLKHPGVVAAAGYETGPSPAEVIDGDRPTGALPIIQMRGELDVNWMLTPEVEDVYAGRYHMNDINRELWEETNGTKDVLPALMIRGNENFLYYDGANAPLINWEVKHMGHREPAYAAEVLWDRLYSGCRLENGAHIVGTPDDPIVPDEDTVLLALGSNKAYRGKEIIPFTENGHIGVRVFEPADTAHFCPVRLNEMGETECYAVPVEFFSKVYGAELSFSDNGDECALKLPDGRTAVLRSKSVLVEIDGRFHGIQKPCLSLYGALYVPVAEVCTLLFGSRISVADDVICITGHYAELGCYTARVIRGLLGGTMRPRKPAEWK